jgi:proteasome lid subunit RPN8/RPN11
MKPSSLLAFRQHADQCYPNECCGVLLMVGKSEQYRPCDNTHEQVQDAFRIDPQSFAALEDEGTIIGICHSHPDASSQPSSHDLAMCEASKLPWHILSWPEADLRTVVPTGEMPPLLNRPFVHGVWDCYAQVKDWYKLELGVTLPEFERTDGWWEGDQELYLDNYANAGFSPIAEDQMQIGDVILMQIQAPRVNHAAVYIGNNMIQHHLYGRLSRRDVYGGYWQRNTRLIVRKDQ